MMLFTEQIKHWGDWEKIFQSIPAFTPLIEHILQKENLPLVTIENVTPGTNAVFRVGEYVVKVFMPLNSGKDYGTDVNVELFGMKWANAHGVPSPKLIADGMVEDKYSFRYMIMESVRGVVLDEIENGLSYDDKVKFGRDMREATDRLNLPCENFTPIDVLDYAITHDEWKNEEFPESFRAELSAYLKNFRMGQKVYCHGDLHCQNILIDENMNVSIVDFADAMYAPAEYELVYIVSSLFEFQRPYMEGYFGGEYAVEDILDLCMTWLPIHAWSHGMLVHNIGPVEEITSFAVMRERLREWIVKEKYAMHIKPLTVDHLPKYAEVIRQSFATVASDFGFTRENFPGHTSFITNERLASKIKDEYYPFGCFVGDKIVGFAALTDMGNGVYDLSDVSVLPDYRHLKYGKALLDYAKQMVAKREGSAIVLSIIEENEPIKTWYATNGFIHTGTSRYDHIPFVVGNMKWEK